MIPAKLQPGDEIRIIAPARSMAIIGQEAKEIVAERFAKLGLQLTFGEHVDEADEFVSSPIESRLADLHEAFADPKVKGILTVIGGFNSNQLLEHIDWQLLQKNPKIFCGYSDITALNNAIFAKTGLVTYSGPHYSTFGQKLHFDHTLDYFKKCLLSSEEFLVEPSLHWTDDAWYLDQNKRTLIENEGFWVINEGSAEGTIVGANLCTFNLLQGTQFMPSLQDAVLFLEDDYESRPHHFDRDLQSLIHLPDFAGVRGLVIGRFQKASEMTKELLTEIIRSKKQLSRIPVIANVDFGHSEPKITFPVGGSVRLEAKNNAVTLLITEH
ncbi:MAG: LD-carboxypeptidase [Candidatus Pacebacteria bacterium CG10_big_fil_rev_8_21_14_0_10_45_6]|nr:MAG: LD-carboxypeptidase [Candidatus Pacebacteria bacterium CG10_big_fil_rev_8_21_14_0_10_45_6]